MGFRVLYTGFGVWGLEDPWLRGSWGLGSLVWGLGLTVLVGRLSHIFKVVRSRITTAFTRG